MALDLTDVRAEILNVKRDLYFNEDATLRFYKVNKFLLELFENWYMPTDIIGNLATGGEYYELKVADVDDDVDLQDVIPVADQVEIQGERYIIVQYSRPRGVTRQWELRLESTSNKTPQE